MNTAARLCLGVCFFLSFSDQTQAQSFEGKVKSTTETSTAAGGMNISTQSSTTMWIKGPRTGMEVETKSSMASVPLTQSNIVIDKEAGKMFTLNRKDKTYMEMPFNSSLGITSTPKFSVKKTDRTETFSGVSCSIYEISLSYTMNMGVPMQTDQQIELWTTEDPKFAALANYFKAERDMQKSKGSVDIAPYYDEISGASVKQVIKSDITMEISGKKTTTRSTTTLTYDEISAENVPDEKVTVPPDFKKVEMAQFKPENGGILSARGSSAHKESDVSESQGGSRGSEVSQTAKPGGGLLGGLFGSSGSSSGGSGGTAVMAPGFEPTGTSADDFLRSAYNINYKITNINKTYDDAKIFLSILINSPEKLTGGNFDEVVSSGKKAGMVAQGISVSLLKDGLNQKATTINSMKHAATNNMIVAMTRATTQAATDAATLPGEITGLLPGAATLLTKLPTEMTGFGLLKLPKVLDQVRKAKANLESAKEQAPILVNNLKELAEFTELLNQP